MSSRVWSTQDHYLNILGRTCARGRLYTTFQGHQSVGSGDEEFVRSLAYIGVAAMLVPADI